MTATDLTELCRGLLAPAFEAHAGEDQVEWSVTIVPSNDMAPIAWVWTSIPLGVIGQKRGGWTQIPALDVAGEYGAENIERMVTGALEHLRKERSEFLANPPDMGPAPGFGNGMRPPI